MYVLNLLPERAWPIYRYILKGCGVNGTGGRVYMGWPIYSTAQGEHRTGARLNRQEKRNN